MGRRGCWISRLPARAADGYPHMRCIPTRGAHPAGIVWQHWGQGDGPALPEALALAERGAASVLVDAPFRRAGARPAKSPQAELKQWLQAAVDIRRAADILITRYGVPAARPGLRGAQLWCYAGRRDRCRRAAFPVAGTDGRIREHERQALRMDAERFIGQSPAGPCCCSLPATTGSLRRNRRNGIPERPERRRRPLVRMRARIQDAQSTKSAENGWQGDWTWREPTT